MSHPADPTPAGPAASRDLDDARPAGVLDDELDEERSTASHDGLWSQGTFRRHRRWWVLGGLFLAAGLVVSVIWGWSATRGVQFTNTGFEITGDDSAVVQFDATRQTGRELVCVLRAQALDHTNVGRTEVTVPASDQRTTRQRYPLRTSARAVTAFVDSCRYK